MIMKRPDTLDAAEWHTTDDIPESSTAVDTVLACHQQILPCSTEQ